VIVSQPCFSQAVAIGCELGRLRTLELPRASGSAVEGHHGSWTGHASTQVAAYAKHFSCLELDYDDAAARLRTLERLFRHASRLRPT